MSERCTWLKRLALLSCLSAASVALGQQPLMDGYNAYPVQQGPMVMDGSAPMPGYEQPYYEPMAGDSHAQHIGTGGGIFGKMASGSCGCGCGCESIGCNLGSCDGCDGGGCGCYSGCNCPTCSGLLSKFCIFCRGEGCYLCRGMALGNPLGALGLLAPYSQGGIAAQRWYDLSIEGTGLQRDAGRSTVLLIDRPAGNVLFSSGDLDMGATTAGLRASASMLFGVGGNLEATFIGLNSVDDSRTFIVGQQTPLTIFSVNTLNGPVNLAEIDLATSLSISEESKFNSGEVNYRRRWVGPYGRFQGSWLIGIRHLDLDEQFTFATDGPITFSSITQTRNSATGAQVGADLWWNVIPGVNLGVEGKGALLGNVSQQTTVLNSAVGGVPNAGFPIFETADDVQSILMAEFSATLVYRISYSWSLKGSYMLIGVDQMALASSNLNPTVNTQNPNQGLLNAFQGRPVGINADDNYTIHGWTFGVEYLW